MSNITALALAQEIGERLKQARLNRNLTQAEVAALAGVVRKTVLNAEKGKEPQGSVLVKVRAHSNGDASH